MNDAPLTGIRVADLSRVFAMPYAGAYLADMGAEVIKIDTHHSQFVDTTRTLNGPYPENEPGDLYWERGGTFQTLNRGKRSLTLDLRVPESLEVLKNLLRVSDIFLENFTPRVLARFGLDYASVKQVRPDLIMVSNTGYGHSGPYSNFGAMATALEPTHGTGAFTGYLEPDAREPNFQDPEAREPNIHSSLVPGTVPNKIANSYTDFLASWSAQLAILACLLYRARTGRGAWIDLAMYQVGASFMGE
ncbi:MAG: CoA transferase, partial [Stenotrophomonas maltophilia]